MKLLTFKDIRSAIITGLTTGVIVWQILLFLDRPTVFGVSARFLMVLVPVAWLAGVQLGYILGRWLPFFNQFGRFVAIGFTNAAVDFGVLYLFIAAFHHTAGVYFTLFKTASFLVALIHSYLWNRTWAFESRRTIQGREFFNFALVALASLLVNVGVASVVAGVPHPSVMPNAWAGVAAVAGSGTALIFSFLGFKLLVFKR